MKGLIIWNFQRYSSVFILIYLVYIVGFIFSKDFNFFSWSDFFLSFEMRIYTSIVFLTIMIHAFIGLWTVGTDYLTKRTLGFLNKPFSNKADIFRKIYSCIYVLLGIIYLAVVLYIIWL